MHRPPIHRPRPRRRSAVPAAAVLPEAAPSALRLAALLVTFVTLLAVLAAAGCRAVEDDTPAPVDPAAAAETMEVRASVPIEGYREVDLARLEAERLDDSWRSSAERDRQARLAGGWAGGTAGDPADSPRGDRGAAGPGAAQPDDEGSAGEAGSARDGSGVSEPRSAGDESRSDDGTAGGTTGAARSAGPDPAAGAAPVERMRRAGGSPAGATPAAASEPGGEARRSGEVESWDDLSPDAFRDFEPRFPITRDGGGPTMLALQRLLDRVRFSPGVIDGRWGKNTEKAVYWLQDALGLEATGEPDRALWERLVAEVGEGSPVRRHRVTAADLEGPFVEIPEEVGEQAELECLCHESPAEALAERFHTTRELLAKLNPEADLDALAAGAELWVPDVERYAKDGGRDDRVARIVVAKDGFYLHALDDRGRLLYHFPTTVGGGYDPSPSGGLRVTATAWDPTFHYQPELFADVPDTEEEHLLPAGPNSPVGLVWMQLSEDNYGIHGTSAPETIGYATSHGCVRLTNWDALYLAGRAAKGTPVEFRGGDAAPGEATETAAAAE